MIMTDPDQYFWLMPGSILTALLGGICGLLGNILRQSLYENANLVLSRIATVRYAVFLTIIFMVIFLFAGAPAPWLHWVVNGGIMEMAAIITVVVTKLDTTPHGTELFPPDSDEDPDGQGSK
jgi:hypothetical protein